MITSPKKYSHEYIGYRCNVKGLTLTICEPGLAVDSPKNPKEFVIINVDTKAKFFYLSLRGNNQVTWTVKKEMIINLE